jgi:ectoine hydroxylase-related dioxygenase (phytanoyl-CoA dioxygenase family)
MGLTEEERFRFDLTGFLVRPAILSSTEVAEIRDYVDRFLQSPDSLPLNIRGMPTGPAEILIDHPQVVDAVQELVGPDIRLDFSFAVWRNQGEDAGQALHQAARLQADPIFGYRVQEGRIFAGHVRVVFELTEITKEDGATQFLVGSHKANFPVPAEHMSLDDSDRSEFLASYACPPGSAIFFTENLLHAGAPWRRPEPRVAVFNLYSHIAVRWHRSNWLRPEVLADLPPERRAYFRESWGMDIQHIDYAPSGKVAQAPTFNTIDRFVQGSITSPPSGFVDAI